MKTKRDLFDVHRFLAYFGNSCRSNVRTGIALTVGIYSALLMMAVGVSFLSMTIDSISYGKFVHVYYPGFVIFIVIYAAVSASSMFFDMNTLEKRTACLMVPASALEKFLARFLLVTVGAWIAFLVGFGLEELTRTKILPWLGVSREFCGAPVVWLYANSLSVPSVGLSFYAVTVNVTFVILLWVQSFYMVGSARWRRFPLQKTTAVLVGFFMLAVLVLSFMGLEGEWPFLRRLMDEGKGPSVAVALNAVFVVWTAANWVIAYCLFKNVQRR